MAGTYSDFFTAQGSFAAALSVLGCWAAYRVLVLFYNISPFHPLASFPGPKIAAASYLYEAYYDWWLVGRYTHEIRRMHEKYGKRLFGQVDTRFHG